MIATVASMTSAKRIKKCMFEKGVNSTIIQTPSPISKEGCGYSVRFNDSDIGFVKDCAFALRVRIRKYYKEVLSEGKIKYIGD